MFTVSYLDEDSNRYDASSHTQQIDAEAQLQRFQTIGLNALQIEEKEVANFKPQILH